MNGETHVAIVDFEPWHFAVMKLRDEDAADLAGLDRLSLIRGWAGGRTVLQGRDPAFIYGYKVMEGTVLFWALSAHVVKNMPLLVTRLARNGVRKAFKAGMHRVMVYCHVENTRSLAWLTRSVGFQVEGLMRRSGPNKQDRYLLSITDRDFKEDERWAV